MKAIFALALVACAAAEQVMTFQSKRFAPSAQMAMPVMNGAFAMAPTMNPANGVPSPDGPMVGGQEAEMKAAAKPKLACHCGTDPATGMMRCSCADKRASTSWNPTPNGAVGPSVPPELARSGEEKGDAAPAAGAGGAAAAAGGAAPAKAASTPKPTSAYTRRMMIENGILTDKDLVRRMMGWKEKPVVLKVSDEKGTDGLKEQTVTEGDEKDAGDDDQKDGVKVSVPYTFDASRPMGLRCQSGMDCVKIKMDCEGKESFECAKQAVCCRKLAKADRDKWLKDDIARDDAKKRQEEEQVAVKKKRDELNKREENVAAMGIQQKEKDKLEALVKDKEAEVKTKRAELTRVITENMAKKEELKAWRLEQYKTVQDREATLNKEEADLRAKQVELEAIRSKINDVLNKRREKVEQIISTRAMQIADTERQLDNKFDMLKGETRDALGAKDMAEQAFNTPLPPPEKDEDKDKAAKEKAAAAAAPKGPAPKPQVRVMVEPIQDQRKGEGQSVIDYSVTPGTDKDAVTKHTVRIKTTQTYPEALVKDEGGHP